MVPARGLPSASRAVGRFEAMVDGVAQDVQQGIDQLVQHVGVDQDVLAHDHELRQLAGGGGGLAHVALQARHDGLHRRHAGLRGQVRQLAHQALLLVHDAGQAGELVLEAQAEVARVGGFLDQRARDRLHFVVLVHFQRVEVAAVVGAWAPPRAACGARPRRGCRPNSPARTGASGWRGPVRPAGANCSQRISVPVPARRS